MFHNHLKKTEFDAPSLLGVILGVHVGKEVRKEIWENGVNWEFGRLEGGSKGKKEGFATSEREEKNQQKEIGGFL